MFNRGQMIHMWLTSGRLRFIKHTGLGDAVQWWLDQSVLHWEQGVFAKACIGLADHGGVN